VDAGARPGHNGRMRPSRNTLRRRARSAGGAIRLAAGLALAALALPGGCQTPRTTRLDLTTLDEQGRAAGHFTEFSRAWFQQADNGIVELVLRCDSPSRVDPTQTITQVAYFKGFWHPRPGVTYADSTQVNARAQYAVLTPPTGVRYDGGAFVSYRIDKATGRLVGWIESGNLKLRYRMGDAVEPFRVATIRGTFVAECNPAQVVNTRQMLQTHFAASREIPPGPESR